MPARRRTIAHLAAFPAKGTPDRRMAALSYGLLAAAVFTALTTATLRDDIPAPVKTQGVKEADVFAAEAAPGYNGQGVDVVLVASVEPRSMTAVPDEEAPLSEEPGETLESISGGPGM